MANSNDRKITPADRAVERVRALHTRDFDGHIHEDVCTHCSDSDDGRWAIWPCRTIQVIDEEMGIVDYLAVYHAKGHAE